MSNFSVKIKIDEILEVQEGENGQGEPWKKVQFIGTETEGDYPKSVGFDLFGGEKVDKFIEFNSVGKEVEVFFNASSREYNGKIYHNRDAWRVTNANVADQGENAAPPAADNGGEEDDDLPF